MFFSRISLREDAPSSRRFWSAFRSPYSVHKAIWNLFGDRPDRERDFLYHVEETSGPPVVYALSARQPENSDELWSVEAIDFAPKLQGGMRLGFLLRANPVRTREGKRHDVIMEEKHRLKARGVPRAEWPLDAELAEEAGAAWLRARSEKAGFRVHAVRADGYRQHDFLKQGDSRRVRFSTVDFTGLLEVLDPTCFFGEALCRGIGHAKGFGCGLLLIRRP
jgi:CRISPR system Cascade subunit CasE